MTRMRRHPSLGYQQKPELPGRQSLVLEASKPQPEMPFGYPHDTEARFLEQFTLSVGARAGLFFEDGIFHLLTVRRYACSDKWWSQLDATRSEVASNGSLSYTNPLAYLGERKTRQVQLCRQIYLGIVQSE